MILRMLYDGLYHEYVMVRVSVELCTEGTRCRRVGSGRVSHIWGVLDGCTCCLSGMILVLFVVSALLLWTCSREILAHMTGLMFYIVVHGNCISVYTIGWHGHIHMQCSDWTCATL